jgi:hypothetical protein
MTSVILKGKDGSKSGGTNKANFLLMWEKVQKRIKGRKYGKATLPKLNINSQGTT